MSTFNTALENDYPVVFCDSIEHFAWSPQLLITIEISDEITSVVMW